MEAIMCCQCQSMKPDLVEGGSKEDEGVEGSACVSVVHTFIAVFLIAEISQDLADAFYRHIVHEWCGITCIMLYCVMLCYVMLCYVMLYHIVLCYVMLCYVMLCYVMLCYVMLCYVVLCYVMLCYVMLCCVMVCYVILFLV